MKNNLNTLALLLQVVGLIALLALLSYGYIFIQKGDTRLSVVISFLVVIVLFALVYIMAMSKERKTNRGFTIVEGLCLLGYLGIVVFTFSSLAHYVNVNFLLREEIQSTARSKLDEMKQMVSQYEQQVGSLNSYIEVELENHIQQHRSLNGAYPLADSLKRYGINLSSPKQAQREKDMALSANESAAMRGIRDLKTDNQDFDKRQRNFVDSWNQTFIHGVFKAIDDRLADNMAKLNQNFQVKNPRWIEAGGFNFSLSDRQENLLSDAAALKLHSDYNMVLPLALALVIHLFILLPYFVTGRSGTRPPIYPKIKSGPIKNTIEM